MKESGVIDKTTMVFGQMNEPPGARMRVGLTGLTMAEYFRDVDKGIDIQIPYNYFPEDNPKNTPKFSWRCTANLMFSNWLNYCVYQLTPYNLEELELRNWEWQAGV